MFLWISLIEYQTKWTNIVWNVNPYDLESNWIGIVRKSDLPKIRFHDLRHTHASLLLKAGVHPRVDELLTEKPKEGWDRSQPLNLSQPPNPRPTKLLGSNRLLSFR